MWLHGDWAISLEKPKYWYEVVFLWNYWVFPEKKPMIFTGQGLVMSLTLFFMLDGYTTARLLVTLTLNPNLCCPPQDGNTYSPAGQSSSLLSCVHFLLAFLQSAESGATIRPRCLPETDLSHLLMPSFQFPLTLWVYMWICTYVCICFYKLWHYRFSGGYKKERK